MKINKHLHLLISPSTSQTKRIILALLNTKHMQTFKKCTYIGLSLSSLMLPLATQARDQDKFPKDVIDHPVNGGYISVPRLRKDIAEKFEGPNLIEPNNFFKRKVNRHKYDWEQKPQEKQSQRKMERSSNKPAIADLLKDDSPSGSKNMKNLFQYNEYER